MKLKYSIILLLFCLLFALLAKGQRGKQGNVSLSGNTIINEYTSLSLDASPGVTQITVANAILNANSRFSSSLQPGDLVFIIQMQGMSIDNSDGNSYGSILSYNNCGNHEFKEVRSVSGNAIEFNCGLQFGYSVTGKTQIIRVPRYESLVLLAGANVSCESWNGATGGVLVAEVLGATFLQAGTSFNTSGRGFRGGFTYENNSIYGVTNFRWTDDGYGGLKGEGTAGAWSDYDLLGGRFCKGAPANAGGGGNAHNAGGGGGGNAGNPGSYTGLGNPSLSTPAWSAAWNLEFPGFAAFTSSGGGKGGYTFSDNNQNALTTGIFNSLWGGDWRRDNGGRGGAPLDYSSKRIFMGGGGGAGDQNDNKGGDGGAGGGIIYLLTYGNVDGLGSLVSDGVNGESTTNNGTDGAGGGGGGGCIVIQSTGSVNGLIINARGGNGGNQNVNLFTDEAEGPGGGGGGGYVAFGAGSNTVATAGGVHGSTNSFSLSEFTPNGATSGGNGISNGSINSFDIATLQDTICAGQAATLTAVINGTLPIGGSVQWFDVANGGIPLHTGISFTTPVLFADRTYWIGVCPGSFRSQVNVKVEVLTATAQAAVACQGGATSFTALASSNQIGSTLFYNWNYGDGIGTSSMLNDNYTYADAGTYAASFTVTSLGGCSSTVPVSVVVNSSPQVDVVADTVLGCSPFQVDFNYAGLADNYSWNFGNGNTSSVATPNVIYSLPGTYSITLVASNSNGCSTLVNRPNYIVVRPTPTALFTMSDSICVAANLALQNNSPGAGYSYTWNFGDGQTSAATNPTHSYGSAGSYQITFIVTNSFGCESSRVDSVLVLDAPIVNVTASTASGCAPVTVTFTNNTIGNNNFQWYFGDGGSSNVASPSYIYGNAGNFQVLLEVTNSLGCSVSDTISQISVGNQPQASFTALNGCLNDPTQFNDASIANPGATYQWLFGDGNTANSNSSVTHLYANAGSYITQLIVSEGLSCADTLIDTVTVHDLPQVSFNNTLAPLCDSATIQFSNATIGGTFYQWYFGDGDSSNLVDPIHFYNVSGNYDVTLIATSTQGCVSSRTIMDAIRVGITPDIALSISDTLLCINDCINLQVTNPILNTNYAWSLPGSSLGNANGTTLNNACYTTAGNFNITLMAVNGQCMATNMLTNIIQVSACSAVAAAFMAADSTICENNCINFFDLSQNATSWNWVFDGGIPATSALQFPGQICYPSSGNFNVMLVVGNAGGLDTLLAPALVTVSAAPPTPTIFMVDDTLYSSAVSGNQWFFNNIILFGATSNYFVPTANGTYSVVVASPDGCTSQSDTFAVIINGLNLNDQTMIRVFPNPVINSFHIQSNETILGLDLYDAMGRLISKLNPVLSEHVLEKLATGSYQLKITFKDAVKIIRLVKQ